jgi:hypothetical protein
MLRHRPGGICSNVSGDGVAVLAGRRLGGSYFFTADHGDRFVADVLQSKWRLPPEVVFPGLMGASRRRWAPPGMYSFALVSGVAWGVAITCCVQSSSLSLVGPMVFEQ